MTFNEEIARWEKKMGMYFDLADRSKLNEDSEREYRYREQALLCSDFIKTLEDLKWDYT